ncbi:Seipin [Orchesella cincta]|uniref:Seipin n=1 Tax=Orchesella cincta TaxID=48709 RepID=A0A1D2NKC8_ORCCI|nr:Seipin [Orchesella cincta]
MPGQLIGRLLGLPAYRDKTTALVLTAQQTIYRAIIVLLTVTAILWMAVFLYVAFYYSYMPAISHTRPVHLQFESCGRDLGLCTFPTANVTLTRRQQLLMVGQPYRILVELDMPESKRNQDLGMFMVCASLKDGEKVTIDKSCRSAMLHYKSPLLHYIMTTSLAPFLLSGSAEEKQLISVELFHGFEEDPLRPVTEATIEIQSQHIEVYSVRLRIHAHFTGLRYFMFHWPVLSGFVGITTNLFFLSVIAILSWYKFFTPKQVVVHVGYDSSAARTLEERRALAKERLMRERSKLVQQKSEQKVVEEPASTKEGLEEPPATCEKESPTPPVKETEKVKEEESRRTSEEYEVIEKEEKAKTVKEADETQIVEVEDEEAFSELDPDNGSTTTGEGSKGGDNEETEEDKENVPATSEEGESSEVRQRKTVAKSDEGTSHKPESDC